METWHGDIDDESEKYRGFSGPLHISRGDQTTIIQSFVKLVTKQVLKLHQTIMVLRRGLVLWNKLSIKEEGGQLLTLI